MIIIQIESPDKCRFWHSWQNAWGDSVTNYMQCQHCKSRKAEQPVRQTVDWLKEANPEQFY